MCLSANFPQTKRNQDFLLEAKEASDVQDLTTQLQTGLSTGQKTGSDNKSSAGGPAQADGHFSVAAKFKQSSETSHRT